jgi:23S rRNA (guanosine2251-2'-O)-methyltransferase
MKKPFRNSIQEKKTKAQLLYGIHPVMEALKEGKAIEKIFLIRTGADSQVAEILKLARQQFIPAVKVPVEKLNRLTSKNHQGVVAVVSPVTYYQVQDIISQAYENGETPLLVIADRITDVRNLGAIARTAWCSGAHALIIPFYDSASLQADAMKASAGALNHLPVCREQNFATLLQNLKLNGIKIMAAHTTGNPFLHEVNLNIPLAILIGSEGEGIHPELLRHCDEIFTIPMVREFDSYNASVAAGMVLYEIMKQRGTPSPHETSAQ